MENCKEIIPSNFVRTNNRTVLMSCSDKVASWNVLGLQGSLLSCFIEPIFLNGLVVTSLFNLENIANALYDRIDLQSLRSLMPIANVNRHKIGYYRPKVVESIFKSSVSFLLLKLINYNKNNLYIVIVAKRIFHIS